ncbi:uncharacterized protein BO66DRAFT_404272 [Aspergillus aculeatinus CBS 121060]|uniref:Uncharacterized protein n=1 Tax=Aspergillus aculeatinus CBS 121060 TaxID=1448322 RepID=A0ACD1H078_9EURO|nr:hypothetical protein BO66DRAFT_404272 [Aspergillus aculeatinus CBS 121060]RAH66914.1 hypothetical protein BO66DRAFT_404272 [Aspergillus aculeatinus CBS 121060]
MPRQDAPDYGPSLLSKGFTLRPSLTHGISTPIGLTFRLSSVYDNQMEVVRTVFLSEHGLDSSGVSVTVLAPYLNDFPKKKKKKKKLERMNIYLNDARGRKYIPRDPSRLKARDDAMWNEQQLGQGHYAEGADLVDQVTDAIRKEAEICDCNQGFQIANLLDGGTRPGMGTLLISRIKEEFLDRMMTAF